MKQFIQKIAEREDLSREEASSAMRCIMEGQATEAQIAGFLMALRLKGEHPDEIQGFVEVMREKSLKISIEDSDAIDMCGTGGDNIGTFNISTVASFVVAGAGATVAKHGNRSVSSSCGSADVLKALGAGDDLAHSSIRFGLGRWTTKEEVDYVADKLTSVVSRLREMSPLYELAKEGVDLSTMQWQTEGH